MPASSLDQHLVRTFPGASVVQVVSGRPDRGDAEVVDLGPVTVTLHDDRVSATGLGRVWTWLVEDLETVHHADDATWSILVVPGVEDHGVAVGSAEVEDFRASLAALLTAVPQVLEAEGSSSGDPTIQRAVDELTRPEPPAPPAFAGAGPANGSPRRLRGWSRRPGGRRGTGATASSGPGTPQTLAGLEARDISAWFGTHHVLDRVSLEMGAGEVTALIGPSGCGKSTFLRILNRMHELIPSASLAGEVLLEGVDVYDPSRKLTDARRQIGMVFQKPNPFPAMSIYDNVVASLQLTGTKADTEVKDHLVETCLSKAGLWNEVRDRLRSPGGGLSGGQQQRLCIARALAIKPRVLLMDEPCSALDPTSTRRIEQTIGELKDEVTIVIVTHNMQQALRVSDRCAFFLAEQGTPGVIVEHGPTDAMFHAPQDQRTNDYVNGRFG